MTDTRGTALQHIAAFFSAGRGHGAEPLAQKSAFPASRQHPILVLHGHRALRCWPTDERPWSAQDDGDSHLNWTVQVDGGIELAGPSTRVGRTRREVAIGVRRWWDDIELAESASRAWHQRLGS